MGKRITMSIRYNFAKKIYEKCGGFDKEKWEKSQNIADKTRALVNSNGLFDGIGFSQNKLFKYVFSDMKKTLGVCVANANGEGELFREESNKRVEAHLDKTYNNDYKKKNVSFQECIFWCYFLRDSGLCGDDLYSLYKEMIKAAQIEVDIKKAENMKQAILYYVLVQNRSLEEWKALNLSWVEKVLEKDHFFILVKDILDLFCLGFGIDTDMALYRYLTANEIQIPASQNPRESVYRNLVLFQKIVPVDVNSMDSMLAYEVEEKDTPTDALDAAFQKLYGLFTSFLKHKSAKSALKDIRRTFFVDPQMPSYKELCNIIDLQEFPNLHAFWEHLCYMTDLEVKPKKSEEEKKIESVHLKLCYIKNTNDLTHNELNSLLKQGFDNPERAEDYKERETRNSVKIISTELKKLKDVSEIKNKSTNICDIFPESLIVHILNSEERRKWYFLKLMNDILYYQIQLLSKLHKLYNNPMDESSEFSEVLKMSWFNKKDVLKHCYTIKKNDDSTEEIEKNKNFEKDLCNTRVSIEKIFNSFNMLFDGVSYQTRYSREYKDNSWCIMDDTLEAAMSGLKERLEKYIESGSLNEADGKIFDKHLKNFLISQKERIEKERIKFAEKLEDREKKLLENYNYLSDWESVEIHKFLTDLFNEDKKEAEEIVRYLRLRSLSNEEDKEFTKRMQKKIFYVLGRKARRTENIIDDIWNILNGLNMQEKEDSLENAFMSELQKDSVKKKLEDHGIKYDSEKVSGSDVLGEFLKIDKEDAKKAVSDIVKCNIFGRRLQKLYFIEKGKEMGRSVELSENIWNSYIIRDDPVKTENRQGVNKIRAILKGERDVSREMLLMGEVLRLTITGKNDIKYVSKILRNCRFSKKLKNTEFENYVMRLHEEMDDEDSENVIKIYEQLDNRIAILKHHSKEMELQYLRKGIPVFSMIMSCKDMG